MSLSLWKSILLCPAVLGATLVSVAAAIAVPTTTTANVSQPTAIQALSPKENSTQLAVRPKQLLVAEQLATSAPSSLAPDANTIDQIVRYGKEGTGSQDDSIGQVTSVSQLRDVQPTDWAFQALQSLVERYGCIAGYP
ncbi:MAG: hypothetical protein JO235_03645, partial [Chroococcidiopsidaceae cyanobacterium CP_BM_RX_35]|nr:hypothetical protein [Chroococcidiopsidaceae cyanobacterium CP_BM_RX_35]